MRGGRDYDGLSAGLGREIERGKGGIGEAKFFVNLNCMHNQNDVEYVA